MNCGGIPMKRIEIDQLIADSTSQLSAAYEYLCGCVKPSGNALSETEESLTEAIIELKLADSAAGAQELIGKILTGMQNAEQELDRTARQLTTEGLKDAVLMVDTFTEAYGAYTVSGLLVELRDSLLTIEDPKPHDTEMNDCIDKQEFSLLPTQDQLEALTGLYQKALENTAETSLLAFDRITNAVPASLGQQIDTDTELLYALSVVKVLQEHDIPTAELSEAIGAYIHTSIYVVNQKSEPHPIDPVLTNDTIVIISLSLAIVVLCVLEVGFLKKLPDELTVRKTVELVYVFVVKYLSSLSVINRALEAVNKALTNKKQRIYEEDQLDYLRRIKREAIKCDVKSAENSVLII